MWAVRATSSRKEAVAAPGRRHAREDDNADGLHREHGLRADNLRRRWVANTANASMRRQEARGSGKGGAHVATEAAGV